MNILGVKEPSLVETVVARPEDDVVVVVVSVSVNVEAVSSTVSEVSSASWEEGESLSGITWDVLSDDNSSVQSQELTSLVGDGVVSSGESSDGL